MLTLSLVATRYREPPTRVSAFKKYVTVSLIVILLKKVRDKLLLVVEGDDNSDDVLLDQNVIECADEMLTTFESHFGDLEKPFHKTVQYGGRQRQVGLHPAWVKAHALDPRFKNLKYVPDEDNQKELVNCLIEEMMEIDVPSIPCVGASSQKVAAKEKGRRKRQKVDADFFREMEADDKLALSEEQEAAEGGGSLKSLCTDEFERYKKAPRQDIMKHPGSTVFSDPLQWWRVHKNKFPRVWQLAKVYLAIPATSCPSERAFSTSGNVLTQKRCQMKSDMASETIFATENIDIVKELRKK